MSRLDPHPLLALMDPLAMWLQESEDYIAPKSSAVNDPAKSWQRDSATVYADAKRAAANIRRRLRVGSNRYVVAFVGLGNVGKSTLFNAIFGHEIVPKWNGPCTRVPVEFERTPTSRFEVEWVQGGRWRNTLTQHDTLETAAAAIKGLVAAGEGQPTADVTGKVVVRVPSPWLSPVLDRGVVIADTPGFGAVGEEGAAHEEILCRYLDEEVAQVFWVLKGPSGGAPKAREKQFWEQRMQGRCDDLVITYADECDDPGRYRSYIGQHILGSGIGCLFHFVSGTRGCLARRLESQDPDRSRQLLEHSGVAALTTRLGRFGDAEARVQLLRGELLQLLEDLTRWQTQHLRAAPLRLPFTPASEPARLRFLRKVGDLQLDPALQTAVSRMVAASTHL